MSNESELLVGYSRPASDPPSTTGVWRGIVTKVNSDDFEFTVPRLSGALYTYLSTATLISPDSLTVGDEILVTFTEGRNDEIVVLGRMSLTGGSSTDPVYQGNPTTEPLGHVDRTDSLISFTDATRTFSISPVAESYEVWCANDRFIKTEEETVQIGSATGLYYIYFDADGVLSAQTDYFDWPVECPTAYVYWNGTTGLLFDERHGVTMDWQTHEYLHRTRGSVIANGFEVYEYASSNESIQVNNGTFFDEDLQVDIVHSTSPNANTWEQQLLAPARIPVLYRQGSIWVLDPATDYPFKLGNTYPMWNWNGGYYTTQEFASNDHGIMWIVATNMLGSPVVSIMGQQVYNNIDDAREQTWEGMDLRGLPIVELRVLAKIIFLTNGTSANANIEILEISDYRRATADATSSAAAVVSHSDLTDLSEDYHPQYLLADGSRIAASLDVTGLVETGNINVRGGGLDDPQIIIDPNDGLGVIRRGSGYFEIYAINEAETGYDNLYLNANVTIDGSGNVGIGTNSPAYNLDVPGTVYLGDSTIGGFVNTDTDEWPKLEWLRDTSGAINWDEGLIKGSSSRGVFGLAHFGIHFHQDRSFAFHTSGWDTEMEIKGDGTLYMKGPVGIGDSTPSYKLDVNGTGRFTGILTMGSHILSTADDFRVGNDNNDFIQIVDSADTIYFRTGGGVRAKTTNAGLEPPSDGFYGLGTSTNRWGRLYTNNVYIGSGNVLLTYNSTVTDKLDVQTAIQYDSYFGTVLTSTSNNDYYTSSDLSYGGYGGSHSFKHDTTLSTSPPGNSAVTAGQFFAANTAVGSTSDARLKKNIQDFDNEIGLEILRRLRPRTFEWDYDDITGLWPHGTQIGLIAQEVDEVFPAWVDYWPQEDARRKSDGQVVERALSLGLDQQFQTMVVSAIQNIADRLEALETA